MAIQSFCAAAVQFNYFDAGNFTRTLSKNARSLEQRTTKQKQISHNLKVHISKFWLFFSELWDT